MLLSKLNLANVCTKPVFFLVVLTHLSRLHSPKASALYFIFFFSSKRLLLLP